MKKRFLRRAIIGYIIVVVSFALANDIIFIRETTSFLISEQLNKHLVRYNYDYQYIDIKKYHQDIKDGMPISIDCFKEMMQPYIDKLKCIQDSIEKKNERLHICESINDSLQVILENVRSDSIYYYKHIMMSDYQGRIDSLEKQLSGRDTTEMIIQGKYVELANMKYQYAVKNYDVQSYIVSHYGSFIPDSLLNLFNKSYSYNLELSNDIYQLEKEMREVSKTISDYSRAFHDNRIETVKFWDFLYYSICVSTTVSFGDIVPNSGLTRLLAVLELLLCLVIVGSIVNTIINRENDKKGIV